MREKLIRFMAGRNGNDQFNMFLLVVELVLIVVSTVLSGSIGRFLSPVIILMICYTYFRMLSRNLNKRRDENTRYLRLKYKLEGLSYAELCEKIIELSLKEKNKK